MTKLTKVAELEIEYFICYTDFKNTPLHLDLGILFQV